MRILQVSDIHGNFESAERIPKKARELKADLIVVAGDITHFGGIKEAAEILEAISEAGLPIFFVSGNCDSPRLLSWTPKEINAINLNARIETFSGYTFIGVGGGSGKFGTLTELEEEEFEEILEKLSSPSRALILVAHSPPHGTEVDFTGTKHIGSTAIRKFVEDVQPILMCTGHAHEGRGITKLGRTVIVNAGPAKNGFCAMIDVDDDVVRPELLKLY